MSAKLDQLTSWLKERKITEVECLISDLTGIARQEVGLADTGVPVGDGGEVGEVVKDASGGGIGDLGGSEAGHGSSLRLLRGTRTTPCPVDIPRRGAAGFCRRPRVLCSQGPGRSAEGKPQDARASQRPEATDGPHPVEASVVRPRRRSQGNLIGCAPGRRVQTSIKGWGLA